MHTMGHVRTHTINNILNCHLLNTHSVSNTVWKTFIYDLTFKIFIVLCLVDMVVAYIYGKQCGVLVHGIMCSKLGQSAHPSFWTVTTSL